MRARRRPLEVFTLLALALGLQGSTCHAEFCSGDGCDDDEPEEDERTELQLLILTPLAGPPGTALRVPSRIVVTRR